MGYIYTKSGKLAKRLYFGAVLLFEGLYYTFKNRVLADGGTFVENELPTISQDAKLVLTPNAYKAGKLYSAVPNDGTGDFIVERDSEATYTGQDGTRRTALANVPRIDWSSGEAALLVEPQRTNLIFPSNGFNEFQWEKTGASIVGSQPSLSLLNDAFKLVESNLNEIHRIRQTNNFIVDGTNKFWSLRVKNAGRRYVVISNVTTFNNDINNLIFDTQLGIYTNADSNNTTLISEVLTPIQLSDGWWEIGFKSNVNNTSYDGFAIGLSSTTSMAGTVYQGDGVSGVYIYGAQLEQASAASSYIPTNASTVTRLADNISVPTPAGVTSITETIDGVEQTPITTIPTTYSLPVGNINKVTML